MRTGTLTLAPLLLISCLAPAAVHGQTTWYVDDDASTGGDGTAWPTAYKYLQDALAVASAGDEIRVAGGTYKPDQDEASNVTAGDREATFQLISGVELYGGFRGCPGSNCGSGDPGERDIVLYESVLSGDLLGDDGPHFANNDENSYHIVTGSGVDETAVLNGFTIIGGNASGVGGGMVAYNGSPTLDACTFTGNTADFGGGIANFTGSSPTLTGCTFIANEARNGNGGGGAIYNYEGSSPTLTSCMFTANSANVGVGGGGAIRNSTNSNAVFANCAFVGNVAVYGGGMMTVNSSPTLVNCTFAANITPVANGRALAFASAGSASPSNAALSNCILWDDGLEIWNDDDSTITITYSDVLGGWPGAGNIDENPLFADPDAGDFTLSGGSPCIDAADNDAVPTDLTLDIDGNPRFIDDPDSPDSGNGAAPNVDMGAFEFQGGNPVPIVSEWGLIALTLLTLTAGTLVLSRKRISSSC